MSIKKGAPTKYTEELANEICDAIASSRCGLQTLCQQNPHWPAKANIFIWLRKYPAFRDQYTRAKQDQGFVSVDYMQELMNEGHHYIDENGNERVDVGMLRVKIDAIKWQAEKLLSKQYGQKANEDKSDMQSVVEMLIDKIKD